MRVRAEGEQFLLQTSGDRGTIDLIEVLQAATNVALDLDARPLPKFITLPRRRRRRRRVDPNAPANGTAAAAGSSSGAGANGAGASSSTGRTSESSAGAAPEDRMGDMLAEEQVSLSGAYNLYFVLTRGSLVRLFLKNAYASTSGNASTL